MELFLTVGLSLHFCTCRFSCLAQGGVSPSSLLFLSCGPRRLLRGGGSGSSLRMRALQALCEVETFDCLRDSWVTGASLNIPRRNTCGTYMSGRHYAIGGFDGMGILASVECYDPRLKNWMEVAPLNTPRSSPMCCVQGKLQTHVHIHIYIYT